MNKKLVVRVSLVLLFIVGLTALYWSYPNKSEARCSNCGSWAWRFKDYCLIDGDPPYSCSYAYSYPGVACCDNISGSQTNCASSSTNTLCAYENIDGDCIDATYYSGSCPIYSGSCINIIFSFYWWESCDYIGTYEEFYQGVPHCI